MRAQWTFCGPMLRQESNGCLQALQRTQESAKVALRAGKDARLHLQATFGVCGRRCSLQQRHRITLSLRACREVSTWPSTSSALSRAFLMFVLAACSACTRQVVAGAVLLQAISS